MAGLRRSIAEPSSGDTATIRDTAAGVAEAALATKGVGEQGRDGKQPLIYGIQLVLPSTAAVAMISFKRATCYDRQGFPGFPSRTDSMRRRSAIIALMLLATGCSSKKAKSKSSKPSLRSLGPASRSKRPKGPKTMGNLLVNAYVDDLKTGPPQKKIAAAQHLASMGPNAKAAVPALESLAADTDAKVSAAAKQALKAIKK